MWKKMERERLINRLLNIFYDIEERKYDGAMTLLDLVIKELELSKEKSFQIMEMKNSIKLIKNTKGYNYEIRLVEKENVNLLEQLDFIKGEIDERIKAWDERDKKDKKD